MMGDDEEWSDQDWQEVALNWMASAPLGVVRFDVENQRAYADASVMSNRDARVLFQTLFRLACLAIGPEQFDRSGLVDRFCGVLGLHRAEAMTIMRVAASMHAAAAAGLEGGPPAVMALIDGS